MSSPRIALVRSPPASTTRTSPGSARLRAAWTIRLSPGRCLTVNAGPARTPPACRGRRRGPPCVIRNIESLMFATAMSRYLATVSSSTLRVRLFILKPIATSSSSALISTGLFPLGHLHLDGVEGLFVVGWHDAFEVILQAKPLLPAQTRCNGPGHKRLDAGVCDGLGRHLELFSPALGVDHARWRQALDRIHPGSRQRLGGGREHDLINP